MGMELTVPPERNVPSTVITLDDLHALWPLLNAGQAATRSDDFIAAAKTWNRLCTEIYEEMKKGTAT